MSLPKTEQLIVDQLVKFDKEASKNLETIDNLRNSVVPLSLQKGDTKRQGVREALENVYSDLEKSKRLLMELIGMCNSTNKTQDLFIEVLVKQIEADTAFRGVKERIADYMDIFVLGVPAPPES